MAEPDPIPDPLSPTVESRPGLLRALGPGMAMAIVVGNVIGSGIFLKPGQIAIDCGNFPLIITAWIVGGVMCILGALCFAELAAMLPRAGGLYVFLREAYGRLPAFLFGFNEFMFGRPATNVALAMGFVNLTSGMAGWKLGTFGSVTCAAVLIAVMAWINIVGVIWGGRVQGATTLVKAGFLAVIIVLPLVLGAAGWSPAVSLANYSTSAPPALPHWQQQFAAILLGIMWAYNGWHDVAPVAEEIRDPQKNLPWSLIGGVGIIMVLYVGANLAYHAVLPMDQIQAIRSGDDKNIARPMFAALLAPWGSAVGQSVSSLVTLSVMCSILGALNSNQLLGPRISFAMGRDDVFFRSLGDVHVNYRTPSVAIVVQTAMSIVLTFAAGALVAFVPRFHDVDIFDLMTEYVIFSASIFYTLCVLALFTLRGKHPEWERPYRTWGYPATPLVFVAFYIWFLVRAYQAKPLESQVALALIVVSVPVYYGWQWYAKSHPRTHE